MGEMGAKRGGPGRGWRRGRGTGLDATPSGHAAGRSQRLLPLALVMLGLIPARAGEVRFTILQFNDVYEIVPPRAPNPGGLARVAPIRDRLKAENPNTYTVLAGDFFSPSALSQSVFEGKKLAGRQMVAVMNALAPDLVTFGNHEFDPKREDFAARMDEGRFPWVSSNVSRPDGSPFHSVPRHRIWTVAGTGGTARIGFIGLTIDSNPAAYVRYGNPIAAARAQLDELRGHYDVLVALTHLRREDDRRLAEAVPEIDLILGGHEHVASFDDPDADRPPKRHAPIAKADANVKTVFIHELTYSTVTRSLVIHSRLESVGSGPAPPSPTRDAVELWTRRGFDGLRGVIAQSYPELAARIARRQGGRPVDQIDFERDLVELPVALNGFEKDVRERRTNLTLLLTDLMLKLIPERGLPRLAILNSGAIRIDDEIPAGHASLYDIYRVLPYQTTVYRTVMKGWLLRKLLDKGLLDDKVRGEGAFLQTNGVDRDETHGTWVVDGTALGPEDEAAQYRVAINDYLLRGGEAQFREFLPKRGDHIDLKATLSLARDGVAIDDGPGNSLDLLSALIQFLMDVDERDPAARALAFPTWKEPATRTVAEVKPDQSFRVQVACGQVPTGDGHPQTSAAPPVDPIVAVPTPSPVAVPIPPGPSWRSVRLGLAIGLLGLGAYLALVAYARRLPPSAPLAIVGRAPWTVAVLILGAAFLVASCLPAT